MALPIVSRFERSDVGSYRLSRLGAELGAALEPLDAWARRWARTLSDG